MTQNSKGLKHSEVKKDSKGRKDCKGSTPKERGTPNEEKCGDLKEENSCLALIGREFYHGDLQFTAVALPTLSRCQSQITPNRLKIQPTLCPRLNVTDKPALHGFLFQHSANNWPLKYAATIPSRNSSANFIFKRRGKMRMV